ncbi:MAG: MBL fold metallo-hydrolase [Hyphomonadaceae bacterium]|nr:MBL fold metallo-hydrolase [Hyphomonadaceae bacterium]
MRWLIGLAVALAALAGAAWYFLLDGAAPTRADGVFELAAYRALVSDDAQATLPTEVRVEVIGENEAPSFAAEAGAFDGARAFAFPAFDVVGPFGDVVIDAAVDEATLQEMSGGKGRFDREAYARLLAVMQRANDILITHEHLDHVMAVARHPAPAQIAPHLRLTAPQLAALPTYAVDGALAPEIAAVAAADFATPTRIAPGIVAHAAPGHSPGSIVIFVRTTSREYLFVGDIAWQMSSIEHLRGRPRLVGMLVPGVDPNRDAVLRQIRALHDLAVEEPDVAIVPAHDAAHLESLVSGGALRAGFEPSS